MFLDEETQNMFTTLVQWKSVLQPFKSACDTQEQMRSACVRWKNNGDMAFYFAHKKKKF